MPLYHWVCPSCDTLVEGDVSLKEYEEKGGEFDCPDCGLAIGPDDRHFFPPNVKVEKLNDKDEPCFDYGLGKPTTSVADKKEKMKRKGLFQLPQDDDHKERIAQDEREHKSRTKRPKKTKHMEVPPDVKEEDFDKYFKKNAGKMIEEAWGPDWKGKAKEMRERGKKKRKKKQLKLVS